MHVLSLASDFDRFFLQFRSTMATRRGMYHAGEVAELPINCDSDDNEELLEFETHFYACGILESLIFHACLFSYIDFVTNLTSDVA